MEGTGDYFILLFLCELYEVNCVTAYSYCELGISFGMSLCIEESFTGENVNVKVVSALLNIAVKERNEVIYLVLCCCHNNFLSVVSIIYYTTKSLGFSVILSLLNQNVNELK